MKKSKTLYVSDLDGTLLNEKGVISHKSGEILRKLVDRGLKFTYATARSYISSKKITADLSSDVPAIVYNGCAIVSSTTGQVLYGSDFTAEERNYAISEIRKNHLSPFVYSYINGRETISYHKDSVNYGMQLYLDSRKGDSRLNPTEKEELYHGDVFYFTLIDEEKKLRPLYLSLQESGKFNMTFLCDKFYHTWWLEIMPKSASKASAALKLKEILHCDRIVSFGDEINDIPMFEISDSCYAMEDSAEELKSIATEVIGSNSNDSVAEKSIFYLKKKSPCDFPARNTQLYFLRQWISLLPDFINIHSI